MPPKKGDIPGYDPVDDDDKAKGGKRSRRKRKGATTDEAIQAGPSSAVPSPTPAQTGYGPGPSVQNPPRSTGKVQTPVPTGARQPIQTPSHSAQAASTRPTQSLVPTGTSQASQASKQPGQETSSTKPSSTPGPNTSHGKDTIAGGAFVEIAAAQPSPTGRLPNRGLAGSNHAKSGSLVDTQSAKSLPDTGASKEKQSISNATNTDSDAEPAKPTQVKHQARPGPVISKAVGAEVFLSTNHFKLTVKDLTLHRYSITVWPEAKGKKLSQMIKDALDLPEFDFLRPEIVSDFAAVLLLPQPLPDYLLKVPVPYKKENSGRDPGANPPSNTKIPSDAEDSSDPSRYHVKFDFIRKVDFNAPSMAEGSADQETLPIVQDLDIVLGHHRKSSSDITMIGKRKAFQLSNPPTDGIHLAQPPNEQRALLVALRGYFSSVRLSTTEISVNVNVSHGPFYGSRDLSDMHRLIQNRPQVHATKIAGLLKGLRVELKHLRPKEIIRTVSGYACPGQGNGYEAHPPRVPRSGAVPGEVEFFEYRSTKPTMGSKDRERAKEGRLTAHELSRCGCDGSYISVYDYFKRKYPSHRISENLPVVNVGNTQHPSYLPLSACFVFTQPAKLKLSPEETAIMQTFAVRAPYQNANSITNDGFPTLGLTAGRPGNQKLATLGITIDPNRVTLKGRVLPQPTLMFDKEKAGKYSAGKSRWSLGGVKFKKAEKLAEWACLNIHKDPQPYSSHELCVENFVKVLTSCGIKSSKPKTTHLRTSSLNQLDTLFQNWQRGNPRVRLVLVVLPDDTSTLYNRIKHLGDVTCGIQTICVVGTSQKFYNIAKYPNGDFRSMQYNANVALKVNIKNGGVNHALGNDQLGFISQGKTMVVGIDVTHPSPGSGNSAPSVAAMVASSDSLLAQWPAEIRVNPARQEKVDTLRPMLQSHLIYWKEKHRSFPEKLLIYRDGVSEGQYQMVLDQELPQLRDACKSVGVKLQITLIVVGKRHHTRFYHHDSKTRKLLVTGRGLDGNPPFGTVVDTGVVDSVRNWDFYLQSHTALDGTARPAHYFVLFDEIFKAYKKSELPAPCTNPSEYLYSITHNMCYLFCRSTTSVSIPPPVYYADIACERGRRWNSRVFDSSQSETGDGNELRDSDVTVNPTLAKTMFYI